MWASNLHSLPSHVYSFSVVAMFDEAAPTDLTRLRETGSTLDIWLVPYKGAGGGLSLCISDANMFATEGPDRGVIETDGRRCCGMFSQDRNGSLSRSP